MTWDEIYNSVEKNTLIKKDMIYNYDYDACNIGSGGGYNIYFNSVYNIDAHYGYMDNSTYVKLGDICTKCKTGSVYVCCIDKYHKKGRLILTNVSGNNTTIKEIKISYTRLWIIIGMLIAISVIVLCICGYILCTLCIFFCTCYYVIRKIISNRYKYSRQKRKSYYIL